MENIKETHHAWLRTFLIALEYMVFQMLIVIFLFKSIKIKIEQLKHLEYGTLEHPRSFVHDYT